MVLGQPANNLEKTTSAVSVKKLGVKPSTIEGSEECKQNSDKIEKSGCINSICCDPSIVDNTIRNKTGNSPSKRSRSKNDRKFKQNFEIKGHKKTCFSQCALPEKKKCRKSSCSRQESLTNEKLNEDIANSSDNPICLKVEKVASLNKNGKVVLYQCNAENCSSNTFNVLEVHESILKEGVSVSTHPGNEHHKSDAAVASKVDIHLNEISKGSSGRTVCQSEDEIKQTKLPDAKKKDLCKKHRKMLKGSTYSVAHAEKEGIEVEKKSKSEKADLALKKKKPCCCKCKNHSRSQSSSSKENGRHRSQKASPSKKNESSTSRESTRSRKSFSGFSQEASNKEREFGSSREASPIKRKFGSSQEASVTDKSVLSSKKASCKKRVSSSSQEESPIKRKHSVSSEESFHSKKKVLIFPLETLSKKKTNGSTINKSSWKENLISSSKNGSTCKNRINQKRGSENFDRLDCREIDNLERDFDNFKDKIACESDINIVSDFDTYSRNASNLISSTSEEHLSDTSTVNKHVLKKCSSGTYQNSSKHEKVGLLQHLKSHGKNIMKSVKVTPKSTKSKQKNSLEPTINICSNISKDTSHMHHCINNELVKNSTGDHILDQKIRHKQKINDFVEKFGGKPKNTFLSPIIEMSPFDASKCSNSGLRTDSTDVDSSVCKQDPISPSCTKKFASLNKSIKEININTDFACDKLSSNGSPCSSQETLNLSMAGGNFEVTVDSGHGETESSEVTSPSNVYCNKFDMSKFDESIKLLSDNSLLRNMTQSYLDKSVLNKSGLIDQSVNANGMLTLSSINPPESDANDVHLVSQSSITSKVSENSVPNENEKVMSLLGISSSTVKGLADDLIGSTQVNNPCQSDERISCSPSPGRLEHYSSVLEHYMKELGKKISAQNIALVNREQRMEKRLNDFAILIQQRVMQSIFSVDTSSINERIINELQKTLPALSLAAHQNDMKIDGNVSSDSMKVEKMAADSPSSQCLQRAIDPSKSDEGSLGCQASVQPFSLPTKVPLNYLCPKTSSSLQIPNQVMLETRNCFFIEDVLSEKNSLLVDRPGEPFKVSQFDINHKPLFGNDEKPSTSNSDNIKKELREINCMSVSDLYSVVSSSTVITNQNLIDQKFVYICWPSVEEQASFKVGCSFFFLIEIAMYIPS